jgi:hypothetical protein
LINVQGKKKTKKEKGNLMVKEIIGYSTGVAVALMIEILLGLDPSVLVGLAGFCGTYITREGMFLIRNFGR